MGSSSGSNKGAGCWVIIGVVLIGAFIHSIVRYVKDRPLYKEAHSAYLVGDCETASPLYLDVSVKDRLFDFGKLKAKSRTERTECDQYLAAVKGGLTGLYQYSIDQPDSHLAGFAREKGTDILNNLSDSADNTALLGEGACDKQDELVAAGWLDEGSTLPKYIYYCARVLLAEGATDAAFERVVSLLEDYPNTAMADKVWETLNSSIDFCPFLGAMSSNAAFITSAQGLPELYLACGRNATSLFAYDQAVDAYEGFMDSFADHDRIGEVEALLAAALIDKARASGSGTIERPDQSGYAPSGVARVVIQNDSPHDLKLVFSGPEARIEYMEACPGCSDYSSLGPMFCPEMGPIGTYELKPGEYQVLVETTNEEDVIPFTGTWGLDGGNEFYSCFFVVTSYY